MRDGIFILVLCLVGWFGFDLLEGQRNAARSERDAALLEVSGLREAARISGEMLAARDAIDLQRTQELNDERIENDGLRRAVDAGLNRLQLNATCTAPATPAAGAGRVVDAATAELTADARQDYFTLRDQLALSRQMILGLQDHVRRVCLR
ncbi:lysis system i-spanin subunit Rz [Pseudomonas poae]|uniref:lysis system i-spanin subunit Rz n=1 Tax=Pseudomonas poae TaxID=200451 RepID=UPI00164654AE|nr:lysis system i-spanin subunit Rz [Pseudomonas poae]MBC3197836.1 lysis protein [Pseudomonas poae]